MLRIPLKVIYSDGREQAVIVSAPDCIAFERHFDRPATDITSGRLEYLWWTTWSALKRQNMTDLEFDSWSAVAGDVTDDSSADGDLAPLASSQPTGG